MDDPTSMSPGSVMPAYPWLLDHKLDTGSTPAKIRVMQKLGVPYPDGFDKIANKELTAQAEAISGRLRKDKIEAPANREIIALIAYLQRIGTDIKLEQKAAAAESAMK